MYVELVGRGVEEGAANFATLSIEKVRGEDLAGLTCCNNYVSNIISVEKNIFRITTKS